MMILAGDVGGTKVRLALFDSEGNNCREEKFASKDFENFSLILKQFLKPTDQINSACFGIAGPVFHRHCKATNLPWEISAEELEQEFRIERVDLINDLEANAWGVKELRPEEFLTINEGNHVEGNRALISAGTGLGQAGFYWDGKEHRPFACEGGHCDFGPVTKEEVELLFYLMERYEHVSYERVLSGKGLHDLYRFFIDTKKEVEKPAVRDQLQTRDAAKVIAEHAAKGSCLACLRACHLFVSIYGSEAGNLALKFLSVGGVFIGGGMAPHLLCFFKEGFFMKGFLHKGRFAPLLSKMPVKIILNDKAALIGAFSYARDKGWKKRA